MCIVQPYYNDLQAKILLRNWSNDRFDETRVTKLWPAGQIRPTKPFHPDRECIL